MWEVVSIYYIIGVFNNSWEPTTYSVSPDIKRQWLIRTYSSNLEGLDRSGWVSVYNFLIVSNITHMVACYQQSWRQFGQVIQNKENQNIWIIVFYFLSVIIYIFTYSSYHFHWASQSPNSWPYYKISCRDYLTSYLEYRTPQFRPYPIRPPYPNQWSCSVDERS